MAFNNTGNKVTLKGYVSSEIVQATDYAIEFKISVPRKTVPGERSFVDVLLVYVNNSIVCTFCREHLKYSTPIIVKGEIRTFYNGDIKVCSDDIQLSSKKK